MSGLVVAEIGRSPATAMATGILADHGAAVIGFASPCEIDSDPGDPAYAVYDRSKRAVGLSLDGAGTQQCMAFLDAADLAVLAWEPAIESSPFSPRQLRARYPHLVACWISSAGRTGLAAQKLWPADIVQAELGLAAEQRGVHAPPRFVGQPMATQGAAHLAVIASLAALIERHASGLGQDVDVTLTDGVAAQLTIFWQRATNAPPASQNWGARASRLRLVARSFCCADGQWIGVHTGAVGAHGRLMTLLGFDTMIAPAKGRSEMAELLSPDEAEFLEQALAPRFAQDTRERWLKRLLAADVCAMPVLEPGQFFQDDAVQFNAMIAEVADHRLGLLKQVAPPARFSLTPARAGRGRPPFGQAPHVWPKCPPVASTAVPFPRKRPLDGVRVLDMGAYYAGPYAARFLAALGADVIKLEPPAGDPMRPTPTAFHGANCGKRSIAVNLQTEAGRSVGQRLATRADILIHNMRPGVAERLGIDEKTVRRTNPTVIYLHAPAWNAIGPNRERQGFATLFSGIAGLHMEGAGSGNPPEWPITNEDYAAGFVAASALLMAYYHRLKTGLGQTIESPQLNAALTLASEVMMTSDGRVIGARTVDHDQRGIGPYRRLYRAADGWIVLAAITDAQRQRARRLCGAEDQANSAALINALGTAIAARTVDENVNAFRAAGVPAAKAVTERAMERFFDDPAHRCAGRIDDGRHPTLGVITSIAMLFRLSASAPGSCGDAPPLGAHTIDILREHGYAEAAIEALLANGAVVHHSAS